MTGFTIWSLTPEYICHLKDPVNQGPIILDSVKLKRGSQRFLRLFQVVSSRIKWKCMKPCLRFGFIAALYCVVGNSISFRPNKSKQSNILYMLILNANVRLHKWLVTASVRIIESHITFVKCFNIAALSAIVLLNGFSWWTTEVDGDAP